MSIRNKPPAPRGTINGNEVGNLKQQGEMILRSAMQSSRKYEAATVNNRAKSYCTSRSKPKNSSQLSTFGAKISRATK